MKHILRDSIIFCIHICGISAIYRRTLLRKGPLVRVIVFHDVADVSWFKKVVELCVSMYHVLTPAQFHAREFHASKINILFTFDDGYQSWIDVCLPVLTSYNIHGLFFINSGLLDVATDQVAVETYMRQQLRIEPKKPLTWNGAQVLVDAGHTIGGHTVSHPDLTTLPLAGALKEIQKDKQVLELRLGVVVTDFAYPFGRKKKL